MKKDIHSPSATKYQGEKYSNKSLLYLVNGQLEEAEDEADETL